MRAKRVKALRAEARSTAGGRALGPSDYRFWRRWWQRRRRETAGSPYVATRRTAAELRAAALRRGAAEAAERAAIVKRRPHLADGWVPIQRLRRSAAICDLWAGKAGAP